MSLVEGDLGNPDGVTPKKRFTNSRSITEKDVQNDAIQVVKRRSWVWRRRPLRLHPEPLEERYARSPSCFGARIGPS